MTARVKLKLQLMCGDEIALGPGKAELLRQIETAGSISGAGRAMGMSYRRAWLLVDTMNRCFKAALVEARPGSGVTSGARLTGEGRAVLAAYEELVAAAEGAAEGKPLRAIDAALRARPRARR